MLITYIKFYLSFVTITFFNDPRSVEKWNLYDEL